MLLLGLFRPINSLPSLAQPGDDVPLLVSRDRLALLREGGCLTGNIIDTRRYSDSNWSRCLSDRVFPTLTVSFIDHAIPWLSNNVMLTVGNNDLKVIILEFND